MFKKYLSALFIFVCLIAIFPTAVFAQSTPSTNSLSIDAFTPSGGWEKDGDVTFVGQFAYRSTDVLNSVITNYKWAYLGNNSNPFIPVWVRIRNIVYAVLLLFILAGAFLLIVTQGQNLTVRKFAIRFILVIILITLSFSIVQFIYQITDIIQGFFLTPDGKNIITTQDLLNISISYQNFIGYRLIGSVNDESVFMTLLLTKLTAATYYAMFAVLIIRKVILWFFIFVSPIFPLLMFFSPLRNSAKIWLGEFFRWVLYAPLFAIFLSGLVVFWQQPPYIPIGLSHLPCGQQVTTPPTYPTATNILLGGPCQIVSQTNDLNVSDSFIQYIVALIMLWVVIILPFVLLKIFMGYLNNIPESKLIQYLSSAQRSLGDRYNLGDLLNIPRGPRGPDAPPQPTGAAKTRPIELIHTSSLADKLMSQLREPTTNNTNLEANLSKNSITSNAQTEHMRNSTLAQSSSELNHNIFNSNSQLEGSEEKQSRTGIYNASSNLQQASLQNSNKTYNTNSNTTNMDQQAHTNISLNSNLSQLQSSSLSTHQNWLNKPETLEILTLTKLSIPKMRDIAKFETALLSNSLPQKEVMHKEYEKLRRVAGVSPIATPDEKQQYQQIKTKIEQASQNGNPVAEAILSATIPLSTDTKKAETPVKIPEVNKVQTIDLDEYEEVKKTWKENYQKMDAPISDGQLLNKIQWLGQEIDKMDKVVTLLNSPLADDAKQAEKLVSEILPFILLGGFSKTEILTYIKAKHQAAKDVLEETKLSQQDEENKVLIDRKVVEKPKQQSLEQELDEKDTEE